MLRRARPLPVSAAAIAWLAGLYALPLAHNVHHRSDHTHGPAPAPHSHRHAAEPALGHAEEHSHPHAEEHPHPHPEKGKVPLDSDHGAGSILHFAAAALLTRGVDLPQPGPAALLPRPPSPRTAPSVPVRIVFVRGPPVTDSL